MLIWLYMLPALWVSTWLPAARVFRCLPLSRIRLAVLPVMYAMLICLAGGISVAVVMVLTKRATSAFTPLLWWLLLCPGLLSLFYGVALRSGPVRSASYGLGIWTMLVVMGNLTRDFFFISRAFRGSPPSMGLSETFWPAAIAGLLLALVGYLALWRSLVMHTPYRPVPQSERGS